MCARVRVAKPDQVQHALVFVIGFNPPFLLLSAKRLLPGRGEVKPTIILGEGVNLTSQLLPQ